MEHTAQQHLEALYLSTKVRAAISANTELAWKMDANTVEPSASQQRTLSFFLAKYLERHGGNDKYEFKCIDVQVMPRAISVVLETGLKNDEGTMAELIGRCRVHAFVGCNGGIKAPVTGKRGAHRYINGMNNVCNIYKG